MPVGIEAWITQIPPITRGWLVLAVLTSLAVVSYILDPQPQTTANVMSLTQQCQLVTPLQLYFSPKNAFVNAQVGLF